MESWKKLIKNDQLLIGIILFLFSFLLSVFRITDRPIHHDESLHLMYGAYPLYIKGLFYKYDPMLHGPLLYHTLFVMFSALGPSILVGRLLPAILGSLISISPLFFKKYIPKHAAIVVSIILIFSPSLTYWSRFLREDLLIIFFQLGALYAFTIVKNSQKYFWFALCLMLQFLVKENSYLTITLLAGYAVYYKIFNTDKLPTGTSVYTKHNLKQIALGVAIGLVIFALFYTNGLSHPAGFLDGLYRKSLSYWFNQHQIERVRGPFIFQTLMLSWYELPIILFLIIHSALLYLQKKWTGLLLIILQLAIALILTFGYEHSLQLFSGLFSLMKAKMWQDVFLFSMLISNAFISTTILLKDKQKAHAFFNYLFWASLFTYSFVGEKVPWLSIYPLLYGIILITYYIKNWSTKNTYILVTIFLMYEIPICLLTNYENNGSANELIAQVQTTRDYQTILTQIQTKIDNNKVCVEGINTWPATWFFFGHPNYIFRNIESHHDCGYILTDTAKSRLIDNYTPDMFRMRHWWVPDYKEMNVWNFIKYAFTHEPWNRPGGQFIRLYSSKNLR